MEPFSTEQVRELLTEAVISDVTDYAIFLLDPTGRIASWNAGAERLKGYRREEILGRHFSCFYETEAAKRGWPAEELRRAAQTGRMEDEGWRVRKDGSRFWASVVITALRAEGGRPRGFIKITRDLTERRRTEALESAGREMTEFLAMLSHELRNPLAPIRNAVTLMGTREITDPTIGWARDVIDRQSALLAHMVQDLLDVTRITLGKIHLRSAPTDMAAVVSRAVELTRPLMEARRHRFDVSCPDEPLLVHGDLARLTQVVGNLLTNAAKYTPDGGSISLTLARESDAAVIRVRDNGMGIRPEMLDRVFEMFAQGQQGIDRKEGGLGVGLAIVRRLIQLHEGSVTARSDGPGRGSEFEIRVPVLAGIPMTSRHAPAPLAGGAGRRALVVDDNHDAAESLAMLLQLWGFEVDVAHDGISALDTAVDRSPDVVLLDLGLPGLDGFEVVRRLRVLPAFEDTPVIAISGYGQEEDRQRAREAGFDAHLAKPVEAELLRATLEQLRTA